MTSHNGSQRALLRLAPEPAAVLKAAHTVRDACRNAGLPDGITQSSTTLASWLVALSTHQAHSDIEVRLDIIGRVARVEVADGHTLAPFDATDHTSAAATQAVHELANSWGYSKTSHGRVIWAVVDAHLRRPTGIVTALHHEMSAPLLARARQGDEGNGS